MLVDAMAQLIGGLLVVLRAALADVVPSSHVRAGWQDISLAETQSLLAAGPLVGISLGQSRRSRTQGAATATTALALPPAHDPTMIMVGAGAAMGTEPSAPGLPVQAALTEQARLDTPVTLTVLVTGGNVQTQRGQIAERIFFALGRRATVLLPLDPSVDPADYTTDPAVAATLVYDGEQPVDRVDLSTRGVARYQVVYTATHQRYLLSRSPLITSVQVDEERAPGGPVVREVIVTAP